MDDYKYGPLMTKFRDAIVNHANKTGDYPTKVYMTSKFNIDYITEYYSLNTIPYYTILPTYINDQPGIITNGEFKFKGESWTE